MKENDLYTNLRTIISAGLAANAAPAYPVLQDFQPTQQGMDSAPTIYLHMIGDHRYGSVQRTDIWDSNTSTMVHTERQLLETSFQLTCYATPNVNDLTIPTANDIAELVAAVLQSDSTIASLKALGLSVLRITDVRHPYFSDDRDQNEASPNFDFTIEHEQVIISTTPIVNTFEYNFNRV